jgi:hypothetical protein
MTDAAKLEPGWYSVFHDGRLVKCIERTDLGWFIDDDLVEDWPYITWTRGPRVEDLLRDAARYGICRRQYAWTDGSEGRSFDEWCDAEIAREAVETKP